MDAGRDDAIDAAAKTLLRSSYVAALVGAGLSAESRIPTFRGPDRVGRNIEEATK